MPSRAGPSSPPSHSFSSEASQSSSQAINTWTSSGPEGPAVLSVAIDQSNSNVVYIATADGVFKSSDGGQNWTAANSGAQFVVIDPTNSSRLFAGGPFNFKRSTDGGQHWDEIIELEFQQTGSVVYRMYRAAYGTWPNAPTRANVTYSQFIADRSQLVGGSGLRQSTITFANNFVQRPEFKQAYPDAMTPTEFVNKLFDTASLTGPANAALRQQQIDAMTTSGKTRAQVLLAVIEISEFKTREYNPSFVLMEYFGYLRRDPDQGGYDFWLNVLSNKLPNDPSGYRAMVCAFITSAEYQLRFGTSITRTNRDCSQ